MLFTLARNYSAIINRLERRWLALAVFSASLIVTLMFWAVMPAYFFDTGSTDYSCCYSVIARDLVAGRGVDFSIGNPGLGFPILIAVVLLVASPLGIPLDNAMMVVSLISMGMISTLVFMLAQLVWSTSRALVAALVWMTYPFGLWLTKQPNSEIPFLVFLYAGLYLVGRGVLTQPQRQSNFFVAGILFGMAMLIRPMAIGIGLLVGLVILLVSRAQPIRWRATAFLVLLCGNLMLLLPWQVWLYSQTGEMVFASSFGISSIRGGLTFGIEHNNYRQPIDLPADVVALMQATSAARDQLHSMSGIAQFLGQELREHPQAVIKLGIIKATRSWYGTDSQRFEQLTLFIQSVYLVLAISGIGLAWRNYPAARPVLILFGLVVLYFWGMAILVLPILRIMVPAMGLLFVFLPGILSVFKKVGMSYKLIELNSSDSTAQSSIQLREDRN